MIWAVRIYGLQVLAVMAGQPNACLFAYWTAALGNSILYSLLQNVGLYMYRSDGHTEQPQDLLGVLQSVHAEMRSVGVVYHVAAIT